MTIWVLHLRVVRNPDHVFYSKAIDYWCRSSLSRILGECLVSPIYSVSPRLTFIMKHLHAVNVFIPFAALEEQVVCLRGLIVKGHTGVFGHHRHCSEDFIGLPFCNINTKSKKTNFCEREHEPVMQHQMPPYLNLGWWRTVSPVLAICFSLHSCRSGETNFNWAQFTEEYFHPTNENSFITYFIIILFAELGKLLSDWGCVTSGHI